jgi:hypothetical protein
VSVVIDLPVEDGAEAKKLFPCSIPEVWQKFVFAERGKFGPEHWPSAPVVAALVS